MILDIHVHLFWLIYLGHTKVEETLKNYSHLFTSTLDEVVAVIDNLDNNKTDDV